MRSAKLIAMAALIAAPAAALAEQPSWPVAFSEARIEAAREQAVKSRSECLAELNHGAEGTACAVYRAGLDRMLDVYFQRNSWCISRLDNRGKPVPPVCHVRPGVTPEDAALKELGYPQFEALSRKVHPDRWARADAARAELDR